MAALQHYTTRQAPPADNTSSQVYLSAVLLSTASLIIMLLIIPPMIWHFRNRNIGATVLVAWSTILLFFNFINAIIWPNDNISNWYNGVGLCDIEIKLQIASQVALPAALACILRALAAVLDTDRATVVQTKAMRRRNYMIDLACCFGAPVLQMIFQYIVQSRRYYIYGISGCLAAVSNSWLTIFLLGVPIWIWNIVDTYYAVLILIRLYRYRAAFRSILANNDTTKSRFMRLYLICILWVLAYIPVQLYTIYVNVSIDLVPYSWSTVHDPENWSNIVMVPSGGSIVYDRWIWLGGGVLVFAFFGFGRDAVNMYRTGLLSVGLGRIFPSLNQDYRGSITGTINSYSSKAKMMFKRKTSSSESTWTSASNPSRMTSSSDPESPLKKTHLESIDESPALDEKQRASSAMPQEPSTTGKSGFMKRITSLFRSQQANGSTNGGSVPLQSFSGESATVESAVVSGPRSPSLASHTAGMNANEMLMRTEVRQGSEHGR